MLDHIRDLEDRAKKGLYRAPPVRRVHIPKGDGQTRPLGLPTVEDKVLQRGVKMLLEPVYEQEFYDFSYGFRPRRSAHDAVEALHDGLWEMGGGWVLDADIQGFFAFNGLSLPTDPGSRSEARGAGGLVVGLALSILAGVFAKGLRRTSLSIAALLFFSYAGARALGVVLDGPPPAMVVQGLVSEVVMGSIAVAGLLVLGRTRGVGGGPM